MPGLIHLSAALLCASTIMSGAMAHETHSQKNRFLFLISGFGFLLLLTACKFLHII